MPLKHRNKSASNSLYWFAGICLAVGILTLLAILLAPKKPPPPPTSEISYAKPPAQRHEPARTEASEPILAMPAGAPKKELAPEEEPAGAELVVYGVVTDEETGAPIRNAYVSVSRDFTEEEFEAQRTAENEAFQSGDEDTYFQIRDRFRELRLASGGRKDTNRKGQYRFALEQALPGQYYLTLWHHSHVRIDKHSFTVAEGDEEIRVDVSMSRGASISGRVYEDGSRAGAPDIGVRVEGLHRWSDKFNTDDDGNYTISGLEEGDYEVFLDINEQPYKVFGIPMKKVTIQSPSQRVTGIDFVVEAAGIVWGYVLDHNQEPVPGTGVLLCSSESIVAQAIGAAMKMAPPISDQSEEDGYYQLPGVPLNEEWRVHTGHEGRGGNGWAPQLSDPFLLTDSQRAIRVDIFVMPGTSVFGHVIDSMDGGPIPYANIICLPAFTKFLTPLEDPQTFNETRSNRDGAFAIHDLPPGEFQLMVQADGYKFSTRGEPIDPDGFHDLEGVILSLIPVQSGQYSVYGYVRDQSGRGIEGVGVNIAGMSGGGISGDDIGTSTDADGYYQIDGMSPGLFILHAEKSGYAPKNVSKVYLDQETNVVLQASAWVKGRVLVKETNRPPEDGYSVRAMATSSQGGLMGLFQEMENLDGGGSRNFSEEDGSFELTLAAGEYTLEANAHGLTPGRTEISVRAGQQLDRVTIYISKTGGRLTGRVVTSDGGSPAGAMVSIAREGTSLASIFEMVADTMQRSLQVDEDGGFEFEGLPAGTYVVVARSNRYARGKSDSVNVAIGRTTSGVQIRLGKGGVLEGYVTRDGMNQMGMMVTMAGAGVTKMGTSDRNGYYHIESVPEGTYLVSAFSPDAITMGAFTPMHATVDIVDGQTTMYNFGEEVGATILGEVSPRPSGGMSFAVVRLPDAPSSFGALDFANLAEAFSEEGSAANYVVGMSRVDGDGYFQLDSIPQGDYVVDIYQADLVGLLSGGMKPVSETPITVIGTGDMQIRVNLKEK